MDSFVLELQKEALEPSVKVSVLMRKALLLAHKLKLKEFHAWVENELSGYQAGASVPDYRIVRGQLMAHNLVRGWIPVAFNSSSEEEMFSKAINGQSVSELESLLEQKSKGTYLSSPVMSEAHKLLNQMSESPRETHFCIFIQYSSIENILNIVRNILLNWTVKLEEKGILGEGMTFTTKDIKSVDSQTFNNFNNFYGSIGQQQLQQGVNNSMQMNITLDVKEVRGYINALEKAYKDLGLRKSILEELEAEVSSIKAQLNSPKPKDGILKEGLKSIRTILEGASGTIAAELLIKLSAILPALFS